MSKYYLDTGAYPLSHGTPERALVTVHTPLSLCFIFSPSPVPSPTGWQTTAEAEPEKGLLQDAGRQ